jgi:hypothetical protein
VLQAVLSFKIVLTTANVICGMHFADTCSVICLAEIISTEVFISLLVLLACVGAFVSSTDFTGHSTRKLLLQLLSRLIPIYSILILSTLLFSAGPINIDRVYPSLLLISCIMIIVSLAPPVLTPAFPFLCSHFFSLLLKTSYLTNSSTLTLHSRSINKWMKPHSDLRVYFYVELFTVSMSSVPVVKAVFDADESCLVESWII